MEAEILNYDFNKIIILLGIALENYISQEDTQLDVLIRTAIEVTGNAQQRMNQRASKRKGL